MFGNSMLFLTCSWRFLISNRLEQLQFKLEKIIGIYKNAGKVRNGILLPKLFWPTVKKHCSSD